MIHHLPASKTGRKSRVFSYQRFSSGSQADGSSLERQDSKFQEFFINECEPMGYVFDSAFVDKETSSYTGKHLAEGQLKAFLKGCENGKVKAGDILAVENMDRLTRMDIIKSVRLVFEIIQDHSVTLVFLDCKHLPPITADAIKEQPWLLGQLEQEMIRAHGESKRKSDLITEGLASVQRQTLAGTRAYSSRGPAWLESIKELQVTSKGIEKMMPVQAEEGFH